MYYDSHIHLSDPEYAPYIDTILNSMESMRINACCVSMDTMIIHCNLLNLQKKVNLYCPLLESIQNMLVMSLEKMINMIEEYHTKISGIGEIGLDPTYVKNEDDTKRQKHVFQTLLEYAEKFEKPVSIHSRKSLDDVLELNE